jgi:AmiR/NasT family two-component response regulator
MHAKRCVMVRGRADERTAYRALQRGAMAQRMKLTKLAEWLLEDKALRVAEMLASC